jgi:hypothetical protein
MSGARKVRLSDRDRRALRLGLRLAAPALLYGFVVKPYVASIRGAKVQLETQSDLLAREQALVAEAPFVPRRIAIARVAANVSQATNVYGTRPDHRNGRVEPRRRTRVRPTLESRFNASKRARHH